MCGYIFSKRTSVNSSRFGKKTKNTRQQTTDTICLKKLKPFFNHKPELITGAKTQNRKIKQEHKKTKQEQKIKNISNTQNAKHSNKVTRKQKLAQGRLN